jgi:adenylate cyclase
MAVASVERRLAAILAADVVGYSRLMGEDEAGTLERLKAHRRELIDPKTLAYHGRIVKLMGDGALVEFASVVDAVQCAAEIQRGMVERNAEVSEDRRIEFRIGINLGDVIVEGDDIYGDGVNVAARLETFAEPGGICISDVVHRNVRGKLDLGFDDLGEQRVKNIAEPVRAYRVRMEPGAAGVAAKVVRPSRLRLLAALAAGLILLVTLGALGWRFYLQPLLQERAFAEQTALPLPDKPSIAVLPFNNMSDDPAQEYFSDGITEDLITDLSRVSGLFVIARNTVFTYKDRPATVEEVARELGVRYVLEGSVRKAGNEVRINAQLIDASTGFHLWADRFDRELEDVFALQDEVTERIVSALEVELTETERESLARRYTESIEAYDVFLRGWEQYWQYSEQGSLQARELYGRAIELDPEFARAYANLAMTYTGNIGSASVLSLERAYDLAQKAIALDDALPQVHWVMALVLLFDKDYDEALASSDRALLLDPNYADAYAQKAWVLQYAGKPEEGLEVLERAKRLNPHFPFSYLMVEGETYFTMGRYEAAIDTLRAGLERNPGAQRLRVFLAASYAQAGRLDEALWEVTELLTLDPDFSLEDVPEVAPYKDSEPLGRLLDGLRKAGLS